MKKIILAMLTLVLLVVLNSTTAFAMENVDSASVVVCSENQSESRVLVDQSFYMIDQEYNGLIN